MDLSYLFSVDISLGDASNTTAAYRVSHYTGDTVTGVVSLRSTCDVRFDVVELLLIGEERTTLLNETAHRRFYQSHFPLHETTLPSPRTIIKNRTYRFPFSFQVPDHLPPNSCSHNIASNPLIHQAHLQPPPSFGDATISGFGGQLRDDFAPPSCRILWLVQFRLLRKNIVSAEPEPILVKSLKLRVKPATDETLHLNLNRGSSEYCLQQTSMVAGKGSRELGTLTVTLEPPKSFYLPLRDPHSFIGNAVRLFLRYTPTEPTEELLQLPRMRSLKGNITATTFYTTSSHHDIPAKKKDIFGKAKNYAEMKFPPWAADPVAGDYAATLLVPVNLPRQNFVPTFHSCLISRVYALSLQLGVHGASGISLRVPVQVSTHRDSLVLPSYHASVGIGA
ncbi:hypothetical protein NUU61_000537 [Penicillium alfredii]|uniref:Arrestin-like N-terminal domain-containing protein n=1 Tax=Penicillium alfredii TaxID=1506179 RepID=A0A9W9KR58_9EURO|nr:uncharacterized protein NUU61_000537 [Penicillium alfredii]KAJ5114778.1 hypothetical protein NUU61_000537 [Penicillium alfredii]